MARVLMISANMMDDPYPVYPLGANLVISAVKICGHDVRLLDLLVDGEEEIEKVLQEYQPDYVAVSMRNVDNVNFNDPHSFVFQYKSLIEKIRLKSKAPIILGGTAYTIFPNEFLRFMDADYGITGPGEISLPKLIRQIEQKSPPKQRIIKGDTGDVCKNDYFLSRETRLAKFYLNKGGMLNIHTKRGCPHQCIYCSYPSLEGDKYLFRQPEAVVDEIIYLKEKHGADFIFFTDSVFNDSNNKYLMIIEEIVRRGVSIPWTCYMRPAVFHADDIRLMKRSGLHSVEWGTDCSSDQTLKGMRKGFCWDEIPGSHFIIFGGPGETPDTVCEGINNLSELKFCVIFAGMGIRVFPNTGICELAQAMGLVKDENDLFYQEIYYNSPDIDVNWLYEFLVRSFGSRKNWFFPWTGMADRNRFMHNSGLRGPLWNFLLRRKKK
jgi:radical SAM superfamily enzyme YgiQ (UPF0313 family)